ncbi:MAG: hypothetical protein ACKOQS_20815 [Dolichospermum sp.]
MSDRTPQTQKAIPTERFAIALPQTLKKRFLRSASLSHISKPQNSDRTPKTQNSDSYGALRYRTSPNPQKAIAHLQTSK